MKSILKTVAVSLVCLLAVNLFADSAAEIKTRMKERLKEVKELKSDGIVGESNKGYLGYPDAAKKTPKSDKTVTDENKDRGQVYSAIAKQQKTTKEKVEERRGIQNVEDAKKGEWVQNKDGKWTQK